MIIYLSHPFQFVKHVLIYTIRPLQECYIHNFISLSNENGFLHLVSRTDTKGHLSCSLVIMVAALKLKLCV